MVNKSVKVELSVSEVAALQYAIGFACRSAYIFGREGDARYSRLRSVGAKLFHAHEGAFYSAWFRFNSARHDAGANAALPLDYAWSACDASKSAAVRDVIADMARKAVA